MVDEEFRNARKTHDGWWFGEKGEVFGVTKVPQKWCQFHLPQRQNQNGARLIKLEYPNRANHTLFLSWEVGWHFFQIKILIERNVCIDLTPKSRERQEITGFPLPDQFPPCLVTKDPHVFTYISATFWPWVHIQTYFDKNSEILLRSTKKKPSKTMCDDVCFIVKTNKPLSPSIFR